MANLPYDALNFHVGVLLCAKLDKLYTAIRALSASPGVAVPPDPTLSGKVIPPLNIEGAAEQDVFAARVVQEVVALAYKFPDPVTPPPPAASPPAGP